MPEGDEALDELVGRMQAIHISRIDEMPRIELYLDQVLSLVCDELSFMALPGEVLLTGSMVNNYVKQRIVPAPTHRRYTRRHVATLLFVCAFKRVFSISEVKALYRACVERGINVASTYDDLVAAVERALAARFSAFAAGFSDEAACVGHAAADGQDVPVAAAHAAVGTRDVPVCPAHAVTLRDASGAVVAPDLDRLMSAGVEAVADKVFVEQVLALHEYNSAR